MQLNQQKHDYSYKLQARNRPATQFLSSGTFYLMVWRIWGGKPGHPSVVVLQGKSSGPEFVQNGVKNQEALFLALRQNSWLDRPVKGDIQQQEAGLVTGFGVLGTMMYVQPGAGKLQAQWSWSRGAGPEPAP